MIICVHPQVFIAGVTQHSELLLHRLLQARCSPVCCHIGSNLSAISTRFCSVYCDFFDIFKLKSYQISYLEEGVDLTLKS